jgi:tetratricopeptide (TPR) repeat protein
MGLRLAGVLAEFWQLRGPLAEGREWLARVLSLPGTTETDVLRAKALCGAGSLARFHEDFPTARRLWEESLAIWRKCGDQQGIAQVLDKLGILVLMSERDHAAARELHEQSLAIWRELGNGQGIAGSLRNLGMAAGARGDAAAARALFEESLAISREVDDLDGQATSLGMLGRLAYSQGDTASMRAFLEASLPIRRQLGDRWGTGLDLFFLGTIVFDEGDYLSARSYWEETLAIDRQRMNRGGDVLLNLASLAIVEGDSVTARALYKEYLAHHPLFNDTRGRGYKAGVLLGLGECSCLEGDHAGARACYEESLALCRELEYSQAIAACLEGLAELHGAQGGLVRAARLIGAAATLREATATCLKPPVRAVRERHVAAVRAALGEDAFAVALEAGRTMSIEEACADALQLDASGRSSHSPPGVYHSVALLRAEASSWIASFGQPRR